jgi:hypothetical protein
MKNIESVNAHDAGKLAYAITLALQGIRENSFESIAAAIDDLDHALWLLGTTQEEVESELEEAELQ